VNLRNAAAAKVQDPPAATARQSARFWLGRNPQNMPPVAKPDHLLNVIENCRRVKGFVRSSEEGSAPPIRKRGADDRL
jgi:hypothetical protein